MGIVTSNGTADAVYWLGRAEAMSAAQEIGAQYGYPILTGLGVAEDATSWFIRADLHAMEQGDSFLILRNPLDVRQLHAAVQDIRDANQQAIIADAEKMHEITEQMQRKERRSAAAKAGWIKRRKALYCECEQSKGYGRASDGSLYCAVCGKRV